MYKFLPDSTYQNLFEPMVTEKETSDPCGEGNSSDHMHYTFCFTYYKVENEYNTPNKKHNILHSGTRRYNKFQSILY